MPSFEITAKNDEYRAGNQMHIDRGQTFTVHINCMGITPLNLFNNSRCADALYRQFQLNGIDVSRTDPLFTAAGKWEIKMK